MFARVTFAVPELGVDRSQPAKPAKSSAHSLTPSQRFLLTSSMVHVPMVLRIECELGRRQSLGTRTHSSRRACTFPGSPRRPGATSSRRLPLDVQTRIGELVRTVIHVDAVLLPSSRGVSPCCGLPKVVTLCRASEAQGAARRVC